MIKSVNIVIIGTGNVAYHLADSFSKTGYTQIVQVFNHQLSKKAKDFAKRINSSLVINYQQINREADMYIIAVKDDAIPEVVKNLSKLRLNGLVMHTSGSVSLDILKPVSKQIGVYYPLQTFYPNASIEWLSTPLLIEANTKAALAKVKALASKVSQKVKVLNSVSRLKMHLAAVFASNFTNAMYVVAYEIIEKNLTRRDTALLFPLMKQSFHKLENVHPLMAQTGPAKRQDKTVMQKHASLLKNNRDLLVIYKSLSDLIQKQQSKKK